MNELVKVGDSNLSVKEFNGQRVVTFKDVDSVHERPDGTARKRFNENKNRFIEGEDYFVRKTDEARKEFDIIAPNGLILITESGYLMLVKSFTDNLAWKVQRELVKSYFNKQKAIDLTQLSPELQMFNRIFQSVAEQQLEQKRQAEKIAEVENRVDSIREVVSLDTTSWRDDTGKILKKIGLSLGGGSMYSQVRSESYELLEKRFGVNLKQRLINKRRRMAEEGESKSKRDKLSNVDIIAGDKKLIEGYTAIVKEMAIHYGVA